MSEARLRWMAHSGLPDSIRFLPVINCVDVSCYVTQQLYQNICKHSPLQGAWWDLYWNQNMNKNDIISSNHEHHSSMRQKLKWSAHFLNKLLRAFPTDCIVQAFKNNLD